MNILGFLILRYTHIWVRLNCGILWLLRCLRIFSLFYYVLLVLMLIPDPWARVSVSKYFCGDAKLHLEHQDAVDAVFNKARDSAVGRELCDRDHGQAGESLLGMTFSFTIAASWQNLGQHCRRSKERLWWLWSKSAKAFWQHFFIYICRV